MRTVIFFLSCGLPWLNPYAFGPSPTVVSLLFSWMCVAALFGFSEHVNSAPRRLGAPAPAAAWLTAALLSAAFGLLQYFELTVPFGGWVNKTDLGEAYANLRQRNQFATLTNIGLAALLWWIVRGPARPAALGDSVGSVPQRRLLAFFIVVFAPLLAAGNAASSSRTGLLQLVTLLILTWIWTRGDTGWRNPAVRRVLLVALVAYGLAALTLPWLVGLDAKSTGILARLHDGDPACASRLTLWGNVLHLIGQKPWLGWGWGELDYAHFITVYPGARFCDILDNAHSLPLHLAVELGIPITLLLCGGGLWLVWQARPWREIDPDRQMAWTVLALILLHSMLEYPLWYGPFQMAAGLCIHLLWVTRTKRTEHDGATTALKLHVKIPIVRVFFRVAAIVLIVFVSYAAWDYQRISQIYLSPEQRSPAYRDNTLEKIRGSWLFQDQVRFAQLTLTPLTADNALSIYDLAKDLLHFSPEPCVIEALIESAVLLGRDDEALLYLQRYRAAFPQRHANWAAMQRHSRCLAGLAPLDCVLAEQ